MNLSTEYETLCSEVTKGKPEIYRLQNSAKGMIQGWQKQIAEPKAKAKPKAEAPAIPLPAPGAVA